MTFKNLSELLMDAGHAASENLDNSMEEYEDIFSNASSPEEIALVNAFFSRLLDQCNGIANLIREYGERIKTGNV
jgi:hypothetical protein